MRVSTQDSTYHPIGKTSVVGTTYFARGSRGARTDVVEFTDNSTLSVTHEIVLPPKRAMTLPTYFNLGFSADSPPSCMCHTSLRPPPSACSIRRNTP